MDKTGATTNNQMFNNFISTVSSRDEISEEDRIMVDHLHSAILTVQNDIDSSAVLQTKTKAMRDFDEIVIPELVTSSLKSDAIIAAYKDCKLIPYTMERKRYLFLETNRDILA